MHLKNNFISFIFIIVLTMTVCAQDEVELPDRDNDVYDQNDKSQVYAKALSEYNAAAGAFDDKLYDVAAKKFIEFRKQYKDNDQRVNNLKLNKLYTQAAFNAAKAYHFVEDYDNAIKYYIESYEDGVTEGLFFASELQFANALSMPPNKIVESRQLLEVARNGYKEFKNRYFKDQELPYKARLGAAKVAYELAKRISNPRLMLIEAVKELNAEQKNQYKKAPEDAEIYYYLGLCHLELGNFDEASDNFKILSSHKYENNDFYARSYLMWGEAAFYRRNWSKAEDLYSKAREVAGKTKDKNSYDHKVYSEALYLLAWANYKNGASRRDLTTAFRKYDECQKNLKEYVKEAKALKVLTPQRSSRISLLRAKCLLMISSIDHNDILNIKDDRELKVVYKDKYENLVEASDELSQIEGFTAFRAQTFYYHAEVLLSLSAFDKNFKNKDCYEVAISYLDKSEKVENLNLKQGERSVLLDSIQLSKARAHFLVAVNLLRELKGVQTKSEKAKRNKIVDNFKKAKEYFVDLNIATNNNEYKARSILHQADIIFYLAELGVSGETFSNSAIVYSKLSNQFGMTDVVRNNRSRIKYQQALCGMKEQIALGGIAKNPVPYTWERLFRKIFEDDLIISRSQKQKSEVDSNLIKMSSKYSFMAFLKAAKTWIKRNPEDYDNIKTYFRRILGKDRLESDIYIPVDIKVEAYKDYATYLFNLGNYSEAARNYAEITKNKEALKEVPLLVKNAYRQQAQSLFRDNNIQGAIDLLNSAFTDFDKDQEFNSQLVVDLADFLDIQKKYAEIISICEEYENRFGNDKSLYYGRVLLTHSKTAGKLYLASKDKILSGKYESVAMKAVAQAVNLLKNSTTLDALQSQKEYAKLLTILAQDTKREDYDQLRTKAMTAYETALKLYNEIKDNDENGDLKKEILINFAALLQNSDSQLAIGKLQEAVKDGGLGKYGAQALYMLGKLYQRRAIFDKAIDNYLKIVYSHVGTEYYYLAIESAADCFVKNKNYKNAIKMWQKYSEKDPVKTKEMIDKIKLMDLDK